jgi:hypothetical protein
MKKKDVKVGIRVVCDAHPFKGRVGTVIKITHVTVHVWCDIGDALGRQLIRMRAKDLVPEEEFLSGIAS